MATFGPSRFSELPPAGRPVGGDFTPATPAPFGPFGFLGSFARGTDNAPWMTLPGLGRALPPRDVSTPDDPYMEEPPREDMDAGAYDLQGADREAFLQQLQLQFSRASEGRQSLVSEANLDEMAYNQEPYAASQLPFERALSLRVPAARARVDKASSEIGAAFDRDGSPVYGATPLTPSMATIAPHVEAYIHQVLTQADATNNYRVGIHRSFKTGTSFLASEVVSRPVSGISQNFTQQMRPPEDAYENALVIRSVKMQDMYILPVGINDLKDAGFVGERFQMPRWMFNDMMADGFYAQPKDEQGQDMEVNNGTADELHGMSQEHSRLNIGMGNISDTDPAGMVDLVRAWVRFQAPSKAAEGERKSKLYYVIFSTRNPRAVMRIKENPYTLLDRAPYVPIPAGMGDGTIWGESWMRLLRSLQHELDTLHMLHIEAVKRASSQFYLVREDSGVLATLKARREGQKSFSEGNANTPQALSRIMPDEWFETTDPAMDIKAFSFADTNGGSFQFDEGRIMGYMNAATIDDMPTAGSVRSAFEMRTAASQTAAKLKSYLKTISSKALKPHIEMVKAQLWEYCMEPSMISEYVKFMDYGDMSIPITMTDFFTGVSLDPAGTTTSADETVAISTTASLIQELVPLILNVPGIVPDVPGAIRELVKARSAALGYQKFETLFGLTPPTEQDQQKAMMYMMLVKQLGQQGQGGQNDPMAGMMNGVMGGDGGAVMGAPSLNAPTGMSSTGDQQGGAANGIAPQMAQEMGAMPGDNAQ